MEKQMKTKIPEFFSDLGYYLSFGLQIALTIIVSFVVVLGAFWLLVFGMFGPMQYWSPWWGFISIPGTLAIFSAIFLAIADWRNW